MIASKYTIAEGTVLERFEKHLAEKRWVKTEDFGTFRVYTRKKQTLELTVVPAPKYFGPYCAIDCPHGKAPRCSIIGGGHREGDRRTDECKRAWK
jgi:hypothetical protein